MVFLGLIKGLFLGGGYVGGGGRLICHNNKPWRGHLFILPATALARALHLAKTGKIIAGESCGWVNTSFSSPKTNSLVHLKMRGFSKLRISFFLTQATIFQLQFVSFWGVFLKKSTFWKSLTKTTLFTALGLSSKGFLLPGSSNNDLVVVYPLILTSFTNLSKGFGCFGWIDLAEAQLAV